MTGPDEQTALAVDLSDAAANPAQQARERARAGRVKARETRARRAAEVQITDVLPVAGVLVDSGLAHLDRVFDYAVPVAMAEAAQAGVRVKVRFAGKDADGLVVSRRPASDHLGTLTPLRRVVSAEPVLHAAVLDVAGELARRYAGARGDVLRLAIPPRHATVEKEPAREPVDPLPHDAAAGAAAWSGHEPGAAFLGHLATGGSPRAVWHAAPATDWPLLLAHAAAATVASGRGVLLCVPDRRDVARLDAALTTVLGPGVHVVLSAEAGPARRYRDFLAVSRGTARVVVGTRSAALAPVADLGLVGIWDDGDDLHTEPRAPYPHTRETLLLRAERQGTAALVGGFARSVEAQHLVDTGWAHPLAGTREHVRAAGRVTVAGAAPHAVDRDPLARVSRLPKEVYAVLRAALATGPVLVQTPRAGYAPALACDRCRTPARCGVCTGPLALAGAVSPPTCRWCGTPHPDLTCAVCGGHGLRAPVVGGDRTAEELGRAFPQVTVRSSGGAQVLDRVGPEPALVVATPGAEPVARDGYAAVVLLDAWLLLSRVDLRAQEEAVRRWSNAVGLLAPGALGIVVGDPAAPALQSLVRWDQPAFARRESDQRRGAHLPPASRLATITGEPGALDDALTLLAPPEGTEVLGPVAVDPAESRQPGPIGQGGVSGPGGHPGAADRSRAVVRVPRAQGAALSAALLELQRLRSARKLDPVRIQVDPLTL